MEVQVRLVEYAAVVVRTDDVECEVVVPRQAVVPYTALTTVPAALSLAAGKALGAALAERVPLPEELGEVLADVGLELEHALLRKYVRDDLALARVLRARAGAEEAALDGHECVVEVGFERSGTVSVDKCQRGRVRDGEMVGC